MQESNPRLAPAEWKSGDRLWLIDLFAPFGHAELALKELRETAVKGKSFKMHSMQPDGARLVITFEG
ncbi:MAG TPA: toxin-activating lysine-acyltransferase [Stellaceae bacterium]|nr:toxin-activating lysine-acyltransferase [Stellaceae bacterium]